MAVSANRLELLQIADAVAREKSIDRMVVIASMQDAMEKAAKTRYGAETEIRVEINPKTGETRTWRLLEIVETVEEPGKQISLKDAIGRNEAAKIGDFITEPLPPIDFSRIAAQSAKQVIVQKVRDAERERMYDEYINRVGEVVNGTVKRFERGDVIVDLGRTEAIVPRSEQARHERWGQGERIRAVIVEVHKQPKGPQIVLSRTDPRLLVRLFEMEVPEIYDGTVVIKAAVRAPGERAKVAVYSRERDVDPVGACVGMKGSRVQAIIRELRGEKIDIIEYSDDLVTFAQSALAPAKITRVSGSMIWTRVTLAGESAFCAKVTVSSE